MKNIMKLFTLFLFSLISLIGSNASAQTEISILTGNVVYVYIKNTDLVTRITAVDNTGRTNSINMDDIKIGFGWPKDDENIIKNMTTIANFFSSYFEGGYELVSTNGTYSEASYILKKK